MPTYKLVYFNGKGRAETTRLAFHAAGVQFEDVRISKDDWPNLKSKTSTGKLPYLEVDGKELTESMAIARFVGKEFGLMGKGNFEQAVIDSIMESITELMEKGVLARMTPDGPQKEAAKKDFLEKHYPRIAQNLEKTLGNKKYLSSDELTLADLHFFSVFEFLSVLTWEDSHPKLKELSERIRNHPKLADYIKNRPKTDF